MAGDSARAESVDAALVTAARNGKAGAFGELYERHRDAVFRYCLARTGGDDDAEELMSEVFVRALETLPRYESGPFVSFLYDVARRAKLAHAGRPSGSSPGADRQTSRSVQRRALITALSRLKTDSRDVLLLCFVEGHDPAETARLLRKTETAVRKLRRRGLESLRRELSKRHEADSFEATA